MNKISLILFFPILIFPSIYISTTTYKYKCADDLKLDTCYLRTEVEKGENTEVTYYVKGCSNNKKCINIRIDNSGYLNQCVKVKKYKKQGDSCVLNEECQSGYCSNGKCSYIEDGKQCEYNQLCKTNSTCKWNGLEGNKGVCVALSSKDNECTSSNDCPFGLLCNKAVFPSVCTEMFSLDIGKDSSEDFLCESGKQYIGKCATTKTINSTCTGINNFEPNCQISYNVGEGDELGIESCRIYEDYYNSYCPLQSDSKEMKDYIKVYKKEREKMSQKDIDKIYVRLMEDNERYTLNGNKKVLEAYVNLKYYKYIDGNDCVRDYFITYLKGNKNTLSMIILSFFLIILLI